MKYKLVKKDKKLDEIGLVLGGLGHILKTGVDIGTTVVPPLVKGGVQLAKWGIPKIGQAGLGALKLGGLSLATLKALGDEIDYDLNKHVAEPVLDKRTGKMKPVRKRDEQIKKLLLVPRELRSECIKLISKLTKTELKESKEIFKVLYKDFVMESSKYLKENTNPINTLALFKGYLESEWKKSKKKSSKS